jgi:hypothetical protein
MSDVDHTGSNQAQNGPGTGPREPFSGRKRDLSSPTQPRTEDIRVYRATPAPEVIAQISHAGLIHDDLAACGLRIRFDAPADGRLEILLLDDGGRHLRSLSPAETAAIATGEIAVQDSP